MLWTGSRPTSDGAQQHRLQENVYAATYTDCTKGCDVQWILFYFIVTRHNILTF